ncbi:dual specificity protein phosphatase 19 [Thecamonas trahens ATCC 50062]|uniref:Dual specificity protein phosphatase 19 n=1 Tax=Thecamonas trahens ATCC 50062 TaxID=461836 RepID=A0A0L0DEG9_THETB|nr:dual specificity protein phosphatase 19 [Thecamonas trahens ATCC 50062]KNC49723.1 dual specificity protein phosphatase 19 [Thecamonas trahens ATCC 50062]|eukprot:XP_013757514.1 dual specificity protein phosphatase 19 [Thecamonas trahens ATCC 50062]
MPGAPPPFARQAWATETSELGDSLGDTLGDTLDDTLDDTLGDVHEGSPEYSQPAIGESSQSLDSGSESDLGGLPLADLAPLPPILPPLPPSLGSEANTTEQAGGDEGTLVDSTHVSSFGHLPSWGSRVSLRFATRARDDDDELRPRGPPYFVHPSKVFWLLVAYLQLFVLSTSVSSPLTSGVRGIGAALGSVVLLLAPWPFSDSPTVMGGEPTGWSVLLSTAPLDVDLASAPLAGLVTGVLVCGLAAGCAGAIWLATGRGSLVSAGGHHLRALVWWVCVGLVGPSVAALASGRGTLLEIAAAWVCLCWLVAVVLLQSGVVLVLPQRFTNGYLLAHCKTWATLRVDLDVLNTESLYFAKLFMYIWLAFEVAFMAVLVVKRPYRSTLFLHMNLWIGVATALQLCIAIPLANSSTAVGAEPPIRHILVAWLSVAILALTSSCLLGYMLSSSVALALERKTAVLANDEPLFWAAAGSGETKILLQAAKLTAARAAAASKARKAAGAEVFSFDKLEGLVGAHDGVRDGLRELAMALQVNDSDGVSAGAAKALADAKALDASLAQAESALREPFSSQLAERRAQLARAVESLQHALAEYLAAPESEEARAKLGDACTLVTSMVNAAMDAASAGLFTSLLEEDLPAATQDANVQLHNAIISATTATDAGDMASLARNVAEVVEATSTLVEAVSSALNTGELGAATRSQLVAVRSKLIAARDAVSQAFNVYAANPDSERDRDAMLAALQAAERVRALAVMDLSAAAQAAQAGNTTIDRGGLIFGSQSQVGLAEAGTPRALPAAAGSSAALALTSPLLDAASTLVLRAHELLSANVNEYAPTLEQGKALLGAARMFLAAMARLAGETPVDKHRAELASLHRQLEGVLDKFGKWLVAYEADPVDATVRAELVPRAAAIIACSYSARQLCQSVTLALLGHDVSVCAMALDTAIHNVSGALSGAVSSASSDAAPGSLAFGTPADVLGLNALCVDLVAQAEDFDSHAQELERALPNPALLQVVYQARASFMSAFVAVATGLDQLRREVGEGSASAAPIVTVVSPRDGSPVASLTRNLYELQLARDRLLLSLSDVYRPVLDTGFSLADAELTDSLTLLRQALAPMLPVSMSGGGKPSRAAASQGDQGQSGESTESAVSLARPTFVAVARLRGVTRNLQSTTNDEVIVGQLDAGRRELEFSTDTLGGVLERTPAPPLTGVDASTILSDRDQRDVTAALDGVAAARVALFAIGFKVEASYLAAEAEARAKSLQSALAAATDVSLTDVEAFVVAEQSVEEANELFSDALQSLAHRRTDSSMREVLAAAELVDDGVAELHELRVRYCNDPVLGEHELSEPLRQLLVRIEGDVELLLSKVVAYNDEALRQLAELLEATSGQSVSLNASFARANFADVRKTVALSQDLLRTIKVLESMLQSALSSLALPALRDVLNGLANEVAFTKASINQGVAAYEANPTDSGARATLRAAQASLSGIRRSVLEVTAVAAVLVDLTRETGTASKLASSLDSAPRRKFFSAVVGVGKVSVDHIEIAGIMGFSSKRLALASPTLRASSGASPRSVVKTTASAISRLRSTARGVAKSDTYSAEDQDLVEAAKALSSAMRGLTGAYKAFTTAVDAKYNGPTTGRPATTSRSGETAAAGSGDEQVTDALTMSTQKLIDAGLAMVEAMSGVTAMHAGDSAGSATIAALMVSQQPVLAPKAAETRTLLERVVVHVRKCAELAKRLRKSNQVESFKAWAAVAGRYNLKFFREYGSKCASGLREAASNLEGVLASSGKPPLIGGVVKRLLNALGALGAAAVDAHYFVAQAGVVVDMAHLGVVASSSRYLEGVSQARSALFEGVATAAKKTASTVMLAPSSTVTAAEAKSLGADVARARSQLSLAMRTLTRILTSANERASVEAHASRASAGLRDLANEAVKHGNNLRTLRALPFGNLPASLEADASPLAVGLAENESALGEASRRATAEVTRLLQDQREVVQRAANEGVHSIDGRSGALDEGLSPRTALGAAFAEMRSAGGSNDMSSLAELLYEGLVEGEMELSEALERMSDFDNMHAVALAGVDAMDATSSVLNVMRRLVLFAFDPMVLDDLGDAQSSLDTAFAAFSSSLAAVRESPNDRSLIPKLRRTMNGLADAKDVVMMVASLPANIADIVRGSALASALAGGALLTEAKRSVFVTLAELANGISHLLRSLDAPNERFTNRARRLLALNDNLLVRVQAVDAEEHALLEARRKRREHALQVAADAGFDKDLSGVTAHASAGELMSESMVEMAAAELGTDEASGHRLLAPLIVSVFEHARAVVVEAQAAQAASSDADDAFDVLNQHGYNFTRAIRTMASLTTATGPTAGSDAESRTMARALADAYRRIEAALPRLRADGKATTETKTAAYDCLDALRSVRHIVGELTESTENGVLATRLAGSLGDIDSATRQVELAVKNAQYAPSSRKVHSLLDLAADAACDAADAAIPLGVCAAAHAEMELAILSLTEAASAATSRPLAGFLEEVRALAKCGAGLMVSATSGIEGTLGNELRRLDEGLARLDEYQVALERDRVARQEAEQASALSRHVHAAVGELIRVAHGVVAAPRELDVALALESQVVRFVGEVDSVVHVTSEWDDAAGSRSVVGVGVGGGGRHAAVPGSRINTGGQASGRDGGDDDDFEVLAWPDEVAKELSDLLDDLEVGCEQILHGVRSRQPARARAGCGGVEETGTELESLLHSMEELADDIVVKDRLFMARKRTADGLDRLALARKYYAQQVDSQSRRRLFDAAKSMLLARRYALEATSRKPRLRLPAKYNVGRQDGRAGRSSRKRRRLPAPPRSVGPTASAGLRPYSPWESSREQSRARRTSPRRVRQPAQLGESEAVREARETLEKYEQRIKEERAAARATRKRLRESRATGVCSSESESGSSDVYVQHNGEQDRVGRSVGRERQRQGTGRRRGERRVSWQRGQPKSGRGKLLADLEALPPIAQRPEGPGALDESTGLRSLRMASVSVGTLHKLKDFRDVFTEVTTELFLGGVGCAQDEELLRKHSISHIINFVYKRISLQNTPSEDIYSLLYDVVEFIQDAVESGGRVFVHCMQGSSRSASLVLAYLMWRDALSYDDAYRYVRYLRAVCSPNPGFEAQLREWANHMLMGGERGGVQLAAHERNRLVIVGKVVKHELMRSSMGPRNCFVLVAPEAGVVFLWLGLRVPDRYVRKAHHVVAQLQHYEGAPARVVEVEQGDESPEFWEALMANQESYAV